MTVKLKLEHGDEVLEFEFDRSEIRIGRGPSNDLVIDDVRLSRLHGTLCCELKHVTFRLEGDCPTRHLRDGVVLASSRHHAGAEWALEPGDRLTIDGDLPIVVELTEVTEEKPPQFERIDPSPKKNAPVARWFEALGEVPGPEELVRALLASFEGDVRAIASIVTSEDEFHNDVVAATNSSDDPPSIHADPLRVLGQLGRRLEEAWAEEWFVAVTPARDGCTRILCPVQWDEALRGVVALEWSRPLERRAIERAAGLLRSFEPIARLVFQAETHRRVARSLREENRYFREREHRHYHFKEIICESPRMRRVYDELNELVDNDAPVLIIGEAGTGKELMARALHHLGTRRQGMMITLKCGRLRDEMIDYELFGCAESQLDGAVAARQGVFELAADGTVFLDEIDKLTPLMQSKIVRMLKEREIRRVGDAVGRTVRARVVAGIHRDLSGLVQKGTLRRDLYLLLKPKTLEVPSLRDRSEDILPLARTFLQAYSERYDARARRLSEGASRALLDHDWPGNVRELQNRIEAAVLDTQSEEISEAHLGF